MEGTERLRRSPSHMCLRVQSRNSEFKFSQLKLTRVNVHTPLLEALNVNT
jgi:hypothetical protein